MTTETTDVRAGEELDIEKLRTFLRAELAEPAGEITIEQFPAGSSNLTYLVRLGTDEYVLRRPPFGNTVKTAHDMRREYEVLSNLSTVYPPAPRPLLFCDDEMVIGSEFYLMERRRGVIVRNSLTARQFPEGSVQLAERFETDRKCQIDVCRAFIANLAELHSLDPITAGLSGLGKPEGYNRRQVEGWTKRYFAAKTHEWPALESSIEWLNSNVPPESGASIIHNDYKFDNVMLDPNDLTRVTAVLDWEMVTIGDPLMDLGTTLGYWISPESGDELLSMPFNPRSLMENISRQQMTEMYAEASGRGLPDLLFYYVFGIFKIAVIAQQIYARFVKGFTNDPRFAGFDRFVSALGSIASNALERGRI
jgi:aminoglycoside phosphotransferase (APT) family kinase protein